MRALTCDQPTGLTDLVVKEVRDPEPGACHVRIGVKAAGINFADLLMVGGSYQERPPFPFSPGLEVAGVVEKIGAGAGLVEAEPGQRVLALLDHGGLAEKALALPEDVIPIPDEMSDVEAAGFAITYGTAFGGLVWRAEVHPGDIVLVHGAAGGVGLCAVEVAKALGGVVIATARGAERLAVAVEHGADHAFDSEDPELKEKIKAVTAPRGVDVVFDPVGGKMFDISLRTIGWEGRIVLIGFASGQVPQIPANILLVKNVSVMGFYFGSYRRHDSLRLRESFDKLFEWYLAGKIRPRISEVLPLERATEALQLLKDRGTTGKVVVRMAD